MFYGWLVWSVFYFSDVFYFIIIFIVSGGFNVRVLFKIVKKKLNYNFFGKEYE